MKRIKELVLVILPIISFSYITVSAQTISDKPSLKLNDFHNWTSLGNTHDINAQGTYVYYSIDDKGAGTQILHLRSVSSGHEKLFDQASNVNFSKDGSLLIGILPGNKLFLYHLASAVMDTVHDVTDYTSFVTAGKEFIAFKNESKQILSILDIKKGKRESYPNCVNYFFSPDFTSLVLIKKPVSNNKEQVLDVVNLMSRESKDVWKGQNAGSVVFDKKSTEFAFSVTDSSADGTPANSIWLYVMNQEKSVMVLDNEIQGIEKGTTLGYIDQFAAGGKSLIFTFRRPAPPQRVKIKKASVDVYSFNDRVPYSEQVADLDDERSHDYKGIFNIDNGKIVCLQQENETGFQVTGNDDYVCISRGFIAKYEFADINGIFLVSSVDGKRIKLPYPIAGTSPDGRYLLLKDEGKAQEFYSYELTSGRIYLLTTQLPIPYKDPRFIDEQLQRIFTLYCWDEVNNKALIADNYDLWAIDLSGKDKPVNITNGFGRHNHIVFGVSDMNWPSGIYTRNITRDNYGKNIFLISYNYNTGDNDYYTINLSKIADPKRLTKGGYAYEYVHTNGGWVSGGNYNNFKATKASVYLIRRENVKEINLFATTDFKTFQPISDNHPERKFNWYTSEMVTYKGLDNSTIHGVLYKPENFDPNKKYPVIFYFYLNMSTNINKYVEPDLSSTIINFPYYVSNDYLIFTPDIDATFNNGVAAKYALNSVLGAANYLSKQPWVDSAKLGIMGHSWGGFESNYIVTHSNKFAAAVTGAGPSDMIGSYALPGVTGHLYFSFKITYDNVPGSIYDHLNAFIENSPKLYADKVTTPILFMHNKNDNAVSFNDGISFFYSLWKLRKKAWLLQYDGGDHFVVGDDNKLDYTIRMKQFFDHYLKDAPAPKWMVEGIPANMKQIDDGLQLEPAGVEPTWAPLTEKSDTSPNN